MRTAQAVLGGGCFWCLEAVFQELPGVLAVEPGYAGGGKDTANYRAVCQGDTGHAEVLRVTYDGERLAYDTLLEAFFLSHDPTTRNRQGHDVGTQYRSVIFTTDASETRIAREVMARLGAEGHWMAPPVTEIVPLPGFYPAEEAHRNYYREHPEQGYCAVVIAPKLAHFRQWLASEKKVKSAARRGL